MEPDDLLCSRNARPPKALVGRAQWKINQAPSLRNNERPGKDEEEWPGCPLLRASNEHRLTVRVARAQKIIRLHPLDFIVELRRAPTCHRGIA